MPSFAAVQRRYRGEDHRVIAAPYYCYCCFYEAKLFLRKFILLLSFSEYTPLHLAALYCHLEVTRLLVESKADVAARDMCSSPPPSHHLSLTICLTAMAELHSNMRPPSPTKPRSLHTCAASVRRNDAHPPALPLPQYKQFQTVRLLSCRAAIAVCRRKLLL